MDSRLLYVVDDNREFLDSICFWLGGDGLDVRALSDPAQAVETIARRDRHRLACLMLDIRMPGMSGLELHDALIQRGADLPVIYISGHADVALTVRAMQKGAVTLLEKPFDEVMLQEALKRAFAAGDRRIPALPCVPPVSGMPVEDHDRAAAAEPAAGVDAEARCRFASRRDRLSPRERQVIEYVIQGVYNKNIADRIGLSIKTVELYRARAMAKMQARSVAELTRMMITAQAD